MSKLGQRTRLKLRIKVWKRDRLPNGTRICYICGAPVSKSTFTLDHIEPRCNTKNNNVDNIAICCYDCNQKKGEQSFEDHLKHHPSLLLKVAKLKYKPASYEILMKQRGIRITLYRLYYETSHRFSSCRS